MLYEIEKNVPVPPKSPFSIYPFKQMQPGDSFFVPTTPETKKFTRSRMSSAMTNAKIALNHKYTSRELEGGYRVWRVE